MQHPINPLYPVGSVGSVDELMAIAVGMEHEAAARYTHLAEAMRGRGETVLAATFQDLARLERDHEQGLARWAEREGWPQPQPTVFPWPLPETFGTEADGQAVDTLTPYRALGIAVDNEERAFTFYTYIAAMADDAAIRERAEGLAREELEHVHRLRVLRRQAFHRQRSSVSPSPAPPRDLTELLALAKGVEQASSELDDAAAAVLANAGNHAGAALLARQAGAARHRSARLDLPPGPGSPAAEAARSAGVLAPGSLSVDGALRLSLRNAEAAAETYLKAAEQAADDQMLAAAQELAEAAIARLAVVRSLFRP